MCMFECIFVWVELRCSLSLSLLPTPVSVSVSVFPSGFFSSSLQYLNMRNYNFALATVNNSCMYLCNDTITISHEVMWGRVQAVFAACTLQLAA